MKKILTFILTTWTLFIAVPLAVAADIGSADTQLLNTPLDKLQLNAVTIALILRLAGEAFSILRKGGGLRHMVLALWFGENVPKAVSEDYHAELGTKPKPEDGQ